MFKEFEIPALTLGGFETVDEGRFLRVTGTGLWTVAMIDAHFVEMSAMLRSRRKVRDDVKMFIDLRDASVQPAVVTAQLSSWTMMLFTARDRVAIVVASSLLKAQMRRVEVVATRELFMSPSAAELWLCAPDARLGIAQVA